MKTTSEDIAARHPEGLICDTDAAYAGLTDRISDILNTKLGFMDNDESKRNVCINLALYFEDLKSETHQFEVFTKIYKEWFGLYLPFYASDDASSPTAELDAAAFILWLSVAAEREGHILNPLNDDVRAVAGMILDLWRMEKDMLPANEELSGYLYSEETQDNPYEVRDILVWIESRSFLGHWYTNSRIDNDEYDMNVFFDDVSDDKLQWEADCLSAFAHRVWPLSLSSSYIYAEMIRMEMDDPDDEVAAYVENMQYAPFGMFRVRKVNNNGFHIGDFKGSAYFIPCESRVMLKSAARNTLIACGLFSYRGTWYLNGISVWIKECSPSYAAYRKEKKEFYSYYHDFVGRYDEFIENHSGERLFFFRNADEYGRWLEKTLGVSAKGMIPEALYDSEPFLAFLEPCGQISLSAVAVCVKHPDNPYYDRIKAASSGLSLICRTGYLTPDLALYLLEHNLLPDAFLGDIKGEGHGRALLQENIEFVLRCTRRDIPRTDAYHRRRNKSLFLDDDAVPLSGLDGKMTFAEFLEAIRDEDYIRSRAGKDWRVIGCDVMTTVIRDVSRNRLYRISTEQMYNIHLAIPDNEIKIATVTPFVGKENAPAANALLYNVIGNGRYLNAIRKIASRLGIVA